MTVAEFIDNRSDKNLVKDSKSQSRLPDSMASSSGLEADSKVSKWFKHDSCTNRSQPADRIVLKKACTPEIADNHDPLFWPLGTAARTAHTGHQFLILSCHSPRRSTLVRFFTAQWKLIGQYLLCMINSDHFCLPATCISTACWCAFSSALQQSSHYKLPTISFY
jgi:hypothetical protein